MELHIVWDAAMMWESMMIDNLCESFGWASNEHLCKLQWTSMLDIQMTLMFCQKEKWKKKFWYPFVDKLYSNMNDEPIRLFHINVQFHMPYINIKY